MFPENFDTGIYKNLNKDLKKLEDKQLITHYLIHGKKEGRICCDVTNRETLKKYIDTNNLDCLEIGPFDCPVLRGSKVKYFDVLNKKDLIERSKKCGRKNHVSGIPYIDYVDSKGNLRIVKEKFDIVLSCHSIEHQVDLIKHLNDVSMILKPKGKYVIIIPDKRFCFDHFLPETTIAEIIDKNSQNRTFHTLKSVIEHRSLTCHNDTLRHWKGDHGKQSFENNPHLIKKSIEEYQLNMKQNSYLDVHSFQFFPDSFSQIIHLLNVNKYINLREERIYQTTYGKNEFYVVLSL